MAGRPGARDRTLPPSVQRSGQPVNAREACSLCPCSGEVFWGLGGGNLKWPPRERGPGLLGPHAGGAGGRLGGLGQVVVVGQGAGLRVGRVVVVGQGAGRVVVVMMVMVVILMVMLVMMVMVVEIGRAHV